MARRARRKVRYSVNMSLNAWDLAKAGAALKIEIHEHGELLGTIKIGQGSFQWHPAHGKKGFKPYRWRDFADYLNERY
jgi:hypothetical protein